MAQDYDYAQLLDDFELGADVMPGEELTEYIERRRREFESKADGGSIGIEVLFRDKKANGGRVPMVSGGALKGLMSLFKGGDKAADLAKQEEIFRSGNITADFLENVNPKVTEKFIRTRDTGGVGGYGMYDSFDDMPNGLKAAELISRIRTADGGINYEAAELFIGKKLKGDETIDELIKMVITEKKADGGRVGLFMGGDPLTGQALDIYTSMNKYGFSDQEIADTLSARGLYGSGNTTTTTPVTNTAPNIINQGGDGDGPPPPPEKTFDKGFSSQNFGLGPNKDVVDYEAEAYGIGPTFKGQVARAFTALSNIPTPFNIARMGIQKAIDFTKQKAAEKKAAEEAAAQAAFEEAMSQGRSFYDQFGKGGAQASQTREQAGTGYDSLDPGSPFAKGGLATMFTRRR